MVREGHGRHAQPPIRLFFQGLVQSVAAADEKCHPALALQRESRQLFRQRLAGAHLSLDAQGYHRPVQLRTDGVGLGRKRLLYLRRGRVLRQPDLRQLQHLQLAVTAQPFDVLRRRVGIELLLQLAHAQHGDALHVSTSLIKKESAPAGIAGQTLNMKAVTRCGPRPSRFPVRPPWRYPRPQPAAYSRCPHSPARYTAHG